MSGVQVCQMFARGVFLCVFLWSSPTLAQTPLALGEVLDSSARTHPKLAEAQAKIDDASGRQLAATSAFDPTAKAEAYGLPLGYYRYWQWAASLEQTVPDTGVQVRVGYRLGVGDLPPYYGERVTRTGGEVFANVSVPLLKDRSIDKQRAELAKARVEVDAVRAQLRSTQLEITRDATIAYWEWVAAGQVLRAVRDLATIARTRAEQISAQAERGARPRIDIVDAERGQWARESDVLDAERKFVEARGKLSLYYRDERQNPIDVALDRVPPGPAPVRSIDAAQVDAWIAEAVANRPDMRSIALARKQARIDLELSRNQQLPKLDVSAFVARDMGAAPSSGASAPGDTDVGVGLSFSVPVFRRQARGDARRARAKLAKLEAGERGLRDRIAASIRVSARAVELAGERVELAGRRLDAAEVMARAERTRLGQGASDLLRVNLRESDVASAAKSAIGAALAHSRAFADLLYALGRAELTGPV